VWKNWCKGLDDAKEESDGLTFLRKTVTPVVEALDKVYRSYGFRVDKAMKLYVMNYPGNYKEAVADQIEMKILPKLNGVELQDEHFGEVKDAMLVAIDATGDNKLRTAFLDACQEGGTFFRWRGVMR
jgi:translation initiation factor IF-2